ncbi:UNKNOWN [Stylonychia lemnae]|uniref:Autophagy-related protein n=1 Tax=Stylonychia lemnae TaxID=5949 RepID=A0A078A173_STYLE|nr:UNKNOWN [Stylonychia lemnae]|eukprot:CDW74534.1 UNKNOWN [Stylonychia lemnae]
MSDSNNSARLSETFDSSQSTLFKQRNPLDKRVKWAEQALEQYPHKYPLIIERAADQSKIIELTNPKFLMPKVFKVSEVQTIIRKKLQLTREQNIFLLANGKHIMKQDQTLMQVYDRHRDDDGFLYIQYALEQTMG